MMLIRSQDKLILTEFSYLRICYIDCGIDSYYGIRANGEMIGKYSSKEKTMTVLDMIEAKYLEPTYINKVGMYQHDNYEHKVFQMPQDEDVIV